MKGDTANQICAMQMLWEHKASKRFLKAGGLI